MLAIIELIYRGWTDFLQSNIGSMAETSEYIHASRCFSKDLITPMRLGKMMLRFHDLDVHARVIVLKHLLTWLKDLKDVLPLKEAELLMTILDSALRQHGSVASWVLTLRCMDLLATQHPSFRRPFHNRLLHSFLTALHSHGPEQQLFLIAELIDHLHKHPETKQDFHPIIVRCILPGDVPFLRSAKLKLLAFLADESSSRVVVAELRVLARLNPDSAARLLPEMSKMLPSSTRPELRRILRSLLLLGHCPISVELLRSDEEPLLSVKDVDHMLTHHPHLFRHHDSATSLRRLCPTRLCRADVLHEMCSVDVISLGQDHPKVWELIDFEAVERRLLEEKESLPAFSMDFLALKIRRQRQSLKQG